MDFLAKYSFVGVPVDLSLTNDGKKELKFRTSWKNTNRSNYISLFQVTDRSAVCLTGSKSGVTVFDFDDFDFYKDLLKDYPELESYLTVRTRRGCHVYFQYDVKYRSPTTKVMIYDNQIKDVDIRNDNGVVICPPTRYRLEDGSFFEYKSNNGHLYPIPDWFESLVDPKFLTSVQSGQKRRRSNSSSSNESFSSAESDDIGNDTDNDTGEFAQIGIPVASQQKWESFLLVKDLISTQRLSDYSEWVRITCSLFNTFGPAAKEEWKKLSKKSSKYDKKQNEKVWKNLLKNKFPAKGGKKATFDVIIDAAKTDNPIEFAAITEEDDIINWELLTHEAYALTMKRLYFSDDSLIFTGSNNPTDGYLFNGVYWQNLDSHREYIKSKYIPKLYEFYKTALLKKGPFISEKLLTKLMADINHLQNVPFRNNVIQALETVCFSSNDKNWNTNPNLFAFEDAIYDLSIGDFIQPRADQFINCTCGYKFYSYDVDGSRLPLEDQPTYVEETKRINDFFGSVVETEDIRDYLLAQISSFLVQENPEEKAFFWLGTGRNGKGAATQLLRSALGNYFSELKLEYYTKPNAGPDSPNCNLYNCRYGRVLNTSEVGEDEQHPDRPQKFLTEKIKFLTGGDLFAVRKPHKADEVKFRAGKPLIQTNMMPTLPGIHLEECVSLRERVEIMMFPYAFITDVNRVRDEPTKYKLQDPYLKTMFLEERFRNAFVRILFQVFRTRTEVEIPEQVHAYKQQYFLENDVVRGYFQSTFTPIPLDRNTDFTQLVKFDLRNLYAEADLKNRSFEQFRREITKLVGKRSPNNKKQTRGVYQNGNTHLMQGYQFLSIDSNDNLNASSSNLSAGSFSSRFNPSS